MELKRQSTLMSLSSIDEHHYPTPIIGNTEQYTSQIFQRRHHLIHLRQLIQPILDTTESPPLDYQGQRNIFRPHNLPNLSTTTSHNSLPNVSAVADGLQNLTIHTHLEHNEWVTGCLVCGKLYEQVIGKTVADCLLQTAQTGVSPRPTTEKKCFHSWLTKRSIYFHPSGSVAGCRLCQANLHSQFGQSNLGRTRMSVTSICRSNLLKL